MKKGFCLSGWLLLLILLKVSELYSQQMPLNKVREQFFSMKEVKDGALVLYYRLQPLSISGNPRLLAYRGAASAASAASVSGVNKKLLFFTNGKAELEQAVKLAPNEMEIRFLRLATQLNAPSFLGYHSDIADDKYHIVNSLYTMKPDDSNAYLCLKVSEFLLASQVLKPDEREKIKLIKERFRR